MVSVLPLPVPVMVPVAVCALRLPGGEMVTTLVVQLSALRLERLLMSYTHVEAVPVLVNETVDMAAAEVLQTVKVLVSMVPRLMARFQVEGTMVRFVSAAV